MTRVRAACVGEETGERWSWRPVDRAASTQAELCHTCVLALMLAGGRQQKETVLLLLLLPSKHAPRLLQHTHSCMRQTNTLWHTALSGCRCVHHLRAPKIAPI